LRPGIAAAGEPDAMALQQLSLATEAGLLVFVLEAVWADAVGRLLTHSLR
jgi:hypothetical protein